MENFIRPPWLSPCCNSCTSTLLLPSLSIAVNIKPASGGPPCARRRSASSEAAHCGANAFPTGALPGTGAGGGGAYPCCCCCGGGGAYCCCCGGGGACCCCGGGGVPPAAGAWISIIEPARALAGHVTRICCPATFTMNGWPGPTPWGICTWYLCILNLSFLKTLLHFVNWIRSHIHIPANLRIEHLSTWLRSLPANLQVSYETRIDDTITHPYTCQPTNRTPVNLATITPSQPAGFLRHKNRS
mmetsp:Transcript_22723/g.36212  ORF Transcript_22723/g.36212 Transcript_22723/m.36212 type:complete len:244 (-) Transcript_22723:915-1646(-)